MIKSFHPAQLKMFNEILRSSDLIDFIASKRNLSPNLIKQFIKGRIKQNNYSQTKAWSNALNDYRKYYLEFLKNKNKKL